MRRVAKVNEDIYDKVMELTEIWMSNQETLLAKYLLDNPHLSAGDVMLCRQSTGDGFRIWVEPKAKAELPSRCADCSCGPKGCGKQ